MIISFENKITNTLFRIFKKKSP